MLQAIEPLSFEAIAILPLMHSIASSFRLVPLADVRVSENSLPDSLTLFESVGPFTLVHFAVGPCVHAFPMRLPVKEVTLISVSVTVAFHTFPVARVVLPLSLINASFAVLHGTEAVSFAFNEFTAIDSLTVVFHAEIRSLAKDFVVKYLALHQVFKLLRLRLPSLRRERLILEGQLECSLFASERYLHGRLIHLVRIAKAA